MVRDVRFNNICIEFSVRNSICKNMIGCSSGFYGDTCVALFIVGMIPKLNIELPKLWWTFLLISKSGESMLKSLAFVITLFAASCFDKTHVKCFSNKINYHYRLVTCSLRSK